jgi:hypothetical protein
MSLAFFYRQIIDFGIFFISEAQSISTVLNLLPHHDLRIASDLLCVFCICYDDADQDTESSIVRQSCPIFLLSDMKKYVLTTDLEFGNTFHLKVAHSGKK